MNRSLLGRVRDLVAPRLPCTTPTGVLGEAEHRVVHALFQLLTDDPGVSATECGRFVDERTTRVAGYLAVYREGLALLARATTDAFPGRAFAALSLAERDAVLARVLRPFPHEESLAPWRRRLHLTPENLDALLAPRAARRFRRFVVRELLRVYYTSAAGWAVVGYDEFPGRVRSEAAGAEVTALRVEGATVLLTLSDGSVERLDPSSVRTDGAAGLVVLAKGGRQRVVFSHKTYYELCELLEETEDGIVLCLGGRAFRLAAP